MEERPGQGHLANWPTGVGGKGNEGVAAWCARYPGAIGYVELIYALQNHITFGAVKNAAGNFVVPSLASATAAAASVKDMPAISASLYHQRARSRRFSNLQLLLGDRAASRPESRERKRAERHFELDGQIGPKRGLVSLLRSAAGEPV